MQLYAQNTGLADGLQLQEIAKHYNGLHQTQEGLNFSALGGQYGNDTNQTCSLMDSGYV
jgi:hypothetical protein